MQEHIQIGSYKIYKEDVVNPGRKGMLYVYPACGEPFTIRTDIPDVFRRLIIEWQGKSEVDEFDIDDPDIWL